MSIEVSNPWWLLLIPVVVAGLIYSGRFLRIQSHRKKIEYLVMRGVVALVLILTLWSELSNHIEGSDDDLPCRYVRQ